MSLLKQKNKESFIMFWQSCTPLSYPCVRAIKTPTLLGVINCAGTWPCLRIWYSDDFYHHSVRTELWHKKRIKNFFILIHACAVLRGLLELHSTRKTPKARQCNYVSKPCFAASPPAPLQFSRVTWQHHIPILLFSLVLFTWISTKGGYLFFSNLMDFYGSSILHKQRISKLWFNIQVE